MIGLLYSLCFHPFMGVFFFFPFNTAFSGGVWEMEANAVSLQSSLSWSLSLNNDYTSNRHSILKREMVFMFLWGYQAFLEAKNSCSGILSKIIYSKKFSSVSPPLDQLPEFNKESSAFYFSIRS